MHEYHHPQGLDVDCAVCGRTIRLTKLKPGMQIHCRYCRTDNLLETFTISGQSSAQPQFRYKLKAVTPKNS